MSHADNSSSTPVRQLSLFDAVCINVGIIIGAGIYESIPRIARNVGGPWGLVGVWVFGGLVALVGSLCYSELTTAFPRQGGEYVFLSRAFGRRVGLLFAWCEFWIVRPGNIGFIALVGGHFASQALRESMRPAGRLWFACGAIVVLTAINVFGVRMAKWTQNVLATIKVGGLAAIVFVAFALLPPATEIAPTTSVAGAEVAATSNTVAAADPPKSPAPAPVNFQLAMIFVLFAYGGWNEMSNVAAEVREPQKNLWRGLVLSAAAVATIYVLVNLAAVRALGYTGVTNSEAVAADVVALKFGEPGRVLISVLICLSCLGSVNGYLFTGARLTYAMGAEHPAFAWLGGWDRRFGTPVRSLLVQAVVTVATIVAFESIGNGFAHLVTFTAPVFWFFFFMVGIALFVLRGERPAGATGQRVVLYPLTPVLFCLTSAFMFWAGMEYALANRSREGWWTLAVLAVGLVVCLFDRPREPREAT